MRICQVHTGVVSIPPNNHGAIEKIIWAYKQELEKLGHQVDIKYLDDINKEDYDIIHIHLANLAHIAKERDMKYYFSLHDHHCLINYDVYLDNLEALRNAEFGIVHSEELLNLFPLNNIEYLQHGVDTGFFKYNSKIKDTHSLLCIAANGIINDKFYDRKGFKLAIESSKILNLPLTICGPSSNRNIDVLCDATKVKFLYDLTEEQLRDVYKEHTIFLNPSCLEAGHPNLTILESISSGLPTICTYEGSLEFRGLKKVKPNITSLVLGIQEVINNYGIYKDNIIYDLDNISWTSIVKKLENIYKGFNVREELISVYDNLRKNENNLRKVENTVNINYRDGVFVEIKGHGDEKFNIEFYKDDILIYNTTITPGMWCAPSFKYYIDWKIRVNDTEYKINLNKQNVLISNQSPSLGDNIAWMPYIEEFRKKHNCNITYYTPFLSLFEKTYPEIKFVPNESPFEDFHAVYKIGAFQNDEEIRERHKEHWKTVPLQKVASDILGIEYEELKPKIEVVDVGRPIDEPYVVITEWSTMKSKLWLYPNAWQEIVDYLNAKGYKVIVISREPTNLQNVINRTNKPIEDTINTIYHSSFGMGPSTGIGWICWSLDKPYIIPSGYSEVWAEYVNEYRVSNTEFCHGCFNNTQIEFKRSWDDCQIIDNKPKPTKELMERLKKLNWKLDINEKYICSKSITPKQVKDMIDKVIEKIR